MVYQKLYPNSVSTRRGLLEESIFFLLIRLSCFRISLSVRVSHFGTCVTIIPNMDWHGWWIKCVIFCLCIVFGMLTNAQIFFDLCIDLNMVWNWRFGNWLYGLIQMRESQIYAFKKTRCDDWPAAKYYTLNSSEGFGLGWPSLQCFKTCSLFTVVSCRTMDIDGPTEIWWIMQASSSISADNSLCK